MKLTTFLMFLATLQISAGVYSQNTRLHLDSKSYSLADVIEAIESQSEFKIFYKTDQVDVHKQVNLTANEKTVASVLDQALEGTEVTYRVLDKLIVLTSSKEVIQQQKVTGKVSDIQSGESLPGVSIQIEGTSIGSITDANGKFSIDIPEANVNGSLTFSYLGYIPEKVQLPVKSPLDVKLVPDIKKLDEVVVVGYGTQKRSDITGSVTSVSKSRLAEIPVTNLTHALEGSTAGLQTTQNSSVPGSTGTMQIRGINSINANTSPFIVLDGIPFFGSTNDISPSDIESIEILKDASAVAIYGTRGSNGVILISTKRGSSAQGKPKINYSGYMGTEGLAHVLKPMDPANYIQKYADFNTQNGLTQTQVLPNTTEVDNYTNGITTDWLKEVTQPGTIQEHNLSINGGTDRVQYYVSGSHLSQQGVVKGYQYKKTSFRSNLDAKITDYLKVGTSAFFTNNDYDGGRVNLLNGLAMSPYSVPRDANGNYNIYPMYPELLYVNPLLGLSVDRLDRGLNLTGDGYAELTPGFVKGFKYRLNASYIYNLGRTAQYTGRQFNDLSGTADVSNTQTTNWVLENILSYTKDIGKHHFDLTGLYSAQKVDYFKSSAQSKSFTNDALSYYNLSAGSTQSDKSEGNSYTLVSQMGRINYSYDSRYLFTVTARRDGYSAFGANNDKYGIFPSMALGWNMANETFMKNLKVVNQLKLRLSYGETGNQAIGVNQTASTAGTVQFPFGGKALTGVLFSNLGNADLHWESTTALNVGVDFGVLNNRISGTIDAYKTETKDILLKRNLPAITGYPNVWANLGKMQNVGIDITLKTMNIVSENFKWSTDLNFSTYKNKILELYGDGKDDLGSNWFIGKPIRVIYDYEKIGIWQEGEDVSTSDPQAKPGDLKFKDQLTVDTNGDGIPDATDGKITTADKVITGQQDPKWIGGMTNTFSYKNFSLRIFIQTSQGGKKSDPDLSYADEAWRRNLPADFKYWTPQHKDNYWPSLAAYKNYRGFQFAEDYSYIRIKDITLSYTVPQAFLSKFKIQGLTIYASGRNLYTFTKWFGWDPEMQYFGRGAGDWTNNYPIVRTVSFGINLSL